MFIKAIIQDSGNVKIIRNYVSKSNLYLYFLMLQNLLISGEKNAEISRIQGIFQVVYTFFGSLDLRHNCVKSHHSGKCVADFREMGQKAPTTRPPSVNSPQKSPS